MGAGGGRGRAIKAISQFKKNKPLKNPTTDKLAQKSKLPDMPPRASVSATATFGNTAQHLKQCKVIHQHCADAKPNHGRTTIYTVSDWHF